MMGSGEPVAEQLIAKDVVHSVTSILLLWSWWTEGGTVCCVCVNVQLCMSSDTADKQFQSYIPI